MIIKGFLLKYSYDVLNKYHSWEAVQVNAIYHTEQNVVNVMLDKSIG